MIPYVSWIFVLIIAYIGIQMGPIAKELVYQGFKLDLKFIQWIPLWVLCLGYSFWSASLKAIVFKSFIYPFFRIVVDVIRNKSEDTNEDSEGKFFNDKDETIMLAKVRKATRSFIWSGVYSGFFFGIIEKFFVDPGLGPIGFFIYLFYGVIWGLLLF